METEQSRVTIMPGKAESQLRLLDRLAQRLSKSTKLSQAKAVRNEAVAALAYIQSAGLGSKLRNYASELKLRAERLAGKLLSGLVLRGGNRRSNSRPRNLKLCDFEVERHQSADWQRASKIPEEQFESYLAAMSAQGEAVTTEGFLRFQRTESASRSKKLRVRIESSHRRSPPKFKKTEEQMRDPLGMHAHPAEHHCGPTADSIKDLKDHFRLLASIIGPACTGTGRILVLIERRTAARIISEIAEILAAI